jgi:hypothetical protein
MMVRWTIWIALALFLAGEIGRRRSARTGRADWWAWPAFAAGAMVCTVHVLLAYHWVHAWSQESVVRETARQTEAVFGLNWGGGAYVNFLFLACWLADAAWWRAAPDRVRPRTAIWLLRAFYLLIIANAAIVFARGSARLAGFVLVGALLAVWLVPPQKVLSPAGRVVT